MNERQQTVETRRQRTNIMLVLMVVAFTISWLPNSVYWLCNDYELLGEDSIFVQQSYFFPLCVHCGQSVAQTARFTCRLHLPILSEIPSLCHRLHAGISMTSTVWNPILYAALNEQLRNGAIQAMPKCCARLMLSMHRTSVGTTSGEQRRQSHRNELVDANNIAMTPTTLLNRRQETMTLIVKPNHVAGAPAHQPPVIMINQQNSADELCSSDTVQL
jgi:hypothetical protein